MKILTSLVNTERRKIMLFWTCLSPVVHVCLEILKLLSVQIRPDIFNQ